MNLLAHFDSLDRVLVAKGFPATSPWWRATLRRFYQLGRRQLVLRVGRRGGKSTTLCRVAVLEALFGKHEIPPGDVGIVGIVSVSRGEAAERLRTIRAILDALGVAYREREQSIELMGRPVVFRVYTASIAGVVGGTWICAILDEGSRWLDKESGANPAREVLASLRPTLATQPNAKIFFSSSPLGSEDAHAAAFDAGDTAFQMVAHAPSWVANPTLTEDGCAELEPDPKIRAREYGALAQSAVSAAFEREWVDACFRPPPSGEWARPDFAIDSSSGRGDNFVAMPVWWVKPSINTEDIQLADYGNGAIGAALDALGRPFAKEGSAARYRHQLVVGDPLVWSGRFVETTDLDSICAEIGAYASDVGARTAFGDQHEELGLRSSLRRAGLRDYIALASTPQNKDDAGRRLRRLMMERRLVLPEHDAAFRLELLQAEERISGSNITITSPRNKLGHGDRLSALIAYLVGESTRRGFSEAGKRPGSPNADAFPASDKTTADLIARINRT